MGEIIQDGARFIQISDGDESKFLQQAAEGEIVLFTALKPHSAKLIATWFSSNTKNWRKNTSSLSSTNTAEICTGTFCYFLKQL